MKILKEESGQAIVIVAAFMGLVALGFLAFAIDVGSLFREKRMAQAAADAAALAAAQEMAANSGNQQTVANAIAKLNGFDTTLATNPASVNLTYPTFNGGTSYVQATVTKPIPTTFLGTFSHSMSTMTVGATAIAGGGKTSSTCVCLGGSSGEVLNLSNNSKLNATSCGIVDNSSSANALGVVGSSTITASTLGTVSSTWNNSTNYPNNVNNAGSIAPSTTIVTGLSSTCTPTMPAAPTWSSCVADPGGSYGTFTFGPTTSSGTICYNGLTVGANGSTCTLNPGIYVINNGTLHFESGSGGHSNLGGNGVFFYLTGTASLQIDSGANVNLVAGGATQSGGGTAPTIGTYNGIVVYQAAADTAAMQFQGGSSTYINGAIYAPGAVLNIGNGSTLTGAVDASSLVMTGGSTINATTDVNEGSITIGSPKVVQ